MLKSTDDLRITNIQPLTTPIEVMREHPRTDAATRTVLAARHDFHNILTGQDDRLAVVVGPCSIHDPKAAIEYAKLLAPLREKLGDRLEIIMRVYFEKPRTTVGWKGLINDPNLDGSFNINQGLHTARALLLEVNNLGLPAACEFLDMTTPQYILGRYWRTHHRKPDSPRTVLRPFLPRWLQERHRWQRQDRPRRCALGLPAAPFPGSNQGWPLRHRRNRGQ
jgi:3-deoxy-D-arabino-heptulosonate 7-phosphate (DAHP) synthase